MGPVFADPKTDVVFKRIFEQRIADPTYMSAEQARMAGFTPAEWDAYDRAKIAEQDARGAISLAERQGEARGRGEGREEGRREGLEKGRREGLAEGRREGFEEGLREAIRGFCQVLEIELSTEREAALAGMDGDELQGLKARLLRERRWS